jgi:hypothetical protein
VIAGNDLSPFQPNPDFPAFYRAGERFSILKVNQGPHWPDEKIRWFLTQHQRALAAGFVVLPYAYLDNSMTGAAAYARARQIAGGKTVIFGDVEFNEDFPQMPDPEVHAFHRAQIAHIGISGTYGLESTCARFPEAKRWVAKWGKTAPRPPWTFWQMGADGFGNDGDNFNGTLEQIRTFVGAEGGDDVATPQDVADALGVNVGALETIGPALVGLTLRAQGQPRPDDAERRLGWDFANSALAGGGDGLAYGDIVKLDRP